jgi:hypothetical protein
MVRIEGMFLWLPISIRPTQVFSTRAKQTLCHADSLGSRTNLPRNGNGGFVLFWGPATRIAAK